MNQQQNSKPSLGPYPQSFGPIIIMPLPISGLADSEEISEDCSKKNDFSGTNNHSLRSFIEKMETESDGNEEVETNNLNSSCALTILNKSSLNNSMELDNEVFYDVYECDQNLNIEEATLNFLKNINHPFLLKSEDLLFEEKRNHIFRRVRITVKRNNNRNFMEKVEKRKGMDWEENEEVFLHKVKKLKV